MVHSREVNVTRVLVTGSSGTIGTRLCEMLLSGGEMEVQAVDRRANEWYPRLNELTWRGDLCDREFIGTLPRDVDVVVHLAANARVYNLVLDPDLALENIRSLYNVLEYCRGRGIGRILFASSREVYGNAVGTCRNEDQVDLRACESPYAASKLSGEALVHAYHRCHGIDFIITRFSNVYGMYDNTDRIIPLFIRLAEQNRDLIIYGRDKMLDFTYIDDTVAGLVQCLQQFERAKNNVFNIATGRGVLLTDVAQRIVRLLGSHSRMVIEGNRAGEVVRFAADISKAEQLLSFRPRVGIGEGLRESIRWYAQHVPRARLVPLAGKSPQRKTR
jgi:nucleoside-diphosphate-sugar epimerase